MARPAGATKRGAGFAPRVLGALAALLAVLTIALGVVLLETETPPPPPAVIVALPGAAAAAPSAAPPATPATASAPVPGPTPVATPETTPGATPGATPAAKPAPGTSSIAPAPARVVVTPPVASEPALPISATLALPPAPDPALIERGRYGFVPKIGAGDRLPWRVYARPFDQNDTKPRIAIVITGLGIGASATDAAIRTLPPAVTLAFAPFARRVSDWANLARAGGHETLLELPMEPVDYPRRDPGYNALLTAYDPPQNLDRLGWAMAQATGYIGFIGRMGARFETSAEGLGPILREIKRRGLVYIDTRSSAQSVVVPEAAAAHLPMAAVDIRIDADPAPAAIDAKLAQLEAIANRAGSGVGRSVPSGLSGGEGAVGSAAATRATLGHIATWAAGLGSRGFRLVPISALIAVPPPDVPADAAPKPGAQP